MLMNKKQSSEKNTNLHLKNNTTKWEEHKMGDEMKYSEGQRNQIYEKYLRPLKLKISQIVISKVV